MNEEEKEAFEYNLMVNTLRFYAEKRNIVEKGLRNDSLHGADLYDSIDTDEGETAQRALTLLGIWFDERREPERIEYR